MTREDQINAELAAKIPAEQQKVGLMIRDLLQLEAFSDDEAIIVAGKYYRELEKNRNTLENVCISIGVLGGFATLSYNADVVVATFIVIVAFISYKVIWKSMRDGVTKNLAVKMKEQSSFSSEMAALRNPRLISQENSFDVPPQES